MIAFWKRLRIPQKATACLGIVLILWTVLAQTYKQRLRMRGLEIKSLDIWVGYGLSCDFDVADRPLNADFTKDFIAAMDQPGQRLIALLEEGGIVWAIQQYYPGAADLKDLLDRMEQLLQKR